METVVISLLGSQQMWSTARVLISEKRVWDNNTVEVRQKTVQGSLAAHQRLHHQQSWPYEEAVLRSERDTACALLSILQL